MRSTAATRAAARVIVESTSTPAVVPSALGKSFDRCATCGTERRTYSFILARSSATGDRVRICRGCAP